MGTARLLIVYRSRKEKIVKVPVGKMPGGDCHSQVVTEEADELS